jgi:glutamate-5-semialdehyde dehydrogenase
MNVPQIAAAAKAASIKLAAADAAVKNSALASIAGALRQHSARIIAANASDLARAAKENLAAPLLKRLNFGAPQIDDVCKSIASLMELDNPVGKTLSATQLDDGLELYKVTCPIGVLGVIFESRPDALVQISTLALKSGNAVLLKGGSEAKETNRVLADIISLASAEAGLPKGWVQLLESRQDVAEMLSCDKDIDLIIPRGSNEFVRHIMQNTSIPVMGHADGICHVYVDAEADLEMAARIAVDSKCQYVAVCNAAETLLVHSDIAPRFLPLAKAALEAKGVEIRGCEKTRVMIEAKPADEQDWRTEYLDYVISVKVVGSLDEAIDHINKYGSHHTEAIVTSDKAAGAKFMDMVDSADVFMNCSTRFSDGFRFGLGAEVGISTSKIHARGPVGMEGLLIYKWKLIGSGQIVADYTGPCARKFTHRKIERSADGGQQ